MTGADQGIRVRSTTAMNNIELNAASYPMISSASRAEAMQRATGTDASTPAAPTLSITRGADQAEFSPAARTMASIPSLPNPRPDVVDRVKNEIASGAYEDGAAFDAKIDAAINEILGEVDAGL